MYQSVCARFECDPSVGIVLNTAKSLFLSANTPRSSGAHSAVSPRITSPKSPSPLDRSSARVKGKTGTVTNVTPTSSREVSYHSISTSESSQFTLPRISTISNESNSSLTLLEEDHDEEPCTPRTSERRRLRRQNSHRRTRTSTLSMDSNASSNDASSMIVEVLQSKNKNLQTALNAERKRRCVHQQCLSMILMNTFQAILSHES